MRLAFQLVPIAVGAVLCVSACKPYGSDETGDDTGVTTGDSTSGASSSSTGAPSGCGDGVLVAPEGCDDGNQLDGDGCNSDCQLSGSMVWCKAELGDDGDGGSNNIGIDVTVDPEGNAVIAGGMYDSEVKAYVPVVLKYAADGTLLWRQVVAPGESRANAVVVRNDGRIVVATEHLLVELSTAGEIRRLSPVFEELLFQDKGLAISADDSIAFAANALGLAPSGIIGVVRDDLSVRWTRNVDDLAAKTESYAVASDLDGDWLLTGTVVVKEIDMGDTGTREIYSGFLRKYDTDGRLRWSQAVPSPDAAYGLVPTSVQPDATNAAVVLSIMTNSAIIDADNMVLTTFDAEGQRTEQVTLANSEVAVYGRDIVVTPSGDRIIAGTKWTMDESIAYGFVDRHSPSGKLRWPFRNTLIPANPSDFVALHEDLVGDLFATGLQLPEDREFAKILVCKINR